MAWVRARNVAILLIVLAVVGLLSRPWMLTYMTGDKTRVRLSTCGSYQDIFFEVAADHPGTWCRVAATGAPVVEAFGIGGGDRRTVTAVVKHPRAADQAAYGKAIAEIERSPGHVPGQPIYGDKIYAPTLDDFALFVASSVAFLGGMGLLGWRGLATARRVRTARSTSAARTVAP